MTERVCNTLQKVRATL